MTSRRPTTAAGLCLAAFACGAGLAIGPVAAPAAAEPLAAPTVAVAPFAGVVTLDDRLADYGWDARPRPAWGVALRADAGRLGGGLRVRAAGTTQAADLPDGARSLDVDLLAAEAFAEATVLRVAGVGLSAGAHGGVLRLAWSPDALDVALGGETVRVDFDPIAEATWGAGLGARRALPGGFALALRLDRAWFRLDTAHRRGGEIVDDRETFGSWIATASVSRRLLPLRPRNER